MDNWGWSFDTGDEWQESLLGDAPWENPGMTLPGLEVDLASLLPEPSGPAPPAPPAAPAEVPEFEFVEPKPVREIVHRKHYAAANDGYRVLIAEKEAEEAAKPREIVTPQMNALLYIVDRKRAEANTRAKCKRYEDELASTGGDINKFWKVTFDGSRFVYHHPFEYLEWTRHRALMKRNTTRIFGQAKAEAIALLAREQLAVLALAALPKE